MGWTAPTTVYVNMEASSIAIAGLVIIIIGIVLYMWVGPPKIGRSVVEEGPSFVASALTEPRKTVKFILAHYDPRSYR